MTQESKLGLVVAQQNAIQDDLLKQYMQKEDRLARRAAIFAATDVPQLWAEAADILVPHYVYELRELLIPLRKFGSPIHRDEYVVGLKMCDGCGGRSWQIDCKKDGTIGYRVNNAPAQLKLDRSDLTQQEFNQSFIDFLAHLIPTTSLMHIEPATRTETKGRRRVVAMA
jgi:hypothetical protein